MLNAQQREEKRILMEQFKKYVPLLYGLFTNKESVSSYIKKVNVVNISSKHEERLCLLRNVLKRKLTGLFGVNFEKELKVDLNDLFAVNIADHHQVINHPFLACSNVLANMHKLCGLRKQKAIIVLSSGNTPPNNFFSQNGFQFHGKRVPIFSNSEHEFTTYFLEKREFDFVDRLKKIGRWHEFNKEEQNFLLQELSSIQKIDFSRCKNYIDQITLLVKEKWPNLFAEKLREKLPELIYITQEEVVSECLIEILKAGGNIVFRTLFEEGFRNVVLDNFRGIVTAWDEEAQKGTHFFWRKHPDRPQSLRMYLEDDYLVPTDKRFSNLKIKLELNDIIDLLKNREIYPNLFLIFTVLNFYLGIKPLCGYGSMTYLSLMKEAWLKTVKYFNLDLEHGLINSIQTNGLVAGLAIFFKRIDGILHAMHAYDIFYDGGFSKKYLKKIFKMKVGDLLLLSIPDTYKYFANKYIPKDEQIEVILKFEDLAEEVFGWVR